MGKAAASLIAGLFTAVIVTSIVSVFLLHDLDSGVTNLPLAFALVCLEGLLFTIVVGGCAGLVSSVAIRLSSAAGYKTAPHFAYLCGCCVGALQYPGDYLTRRFARPSTDAYLYGYFVFAILVCTACLIYNSYRQKRRDDAKGATTYQRRARS